MRGINTITIFILLFVVVSCNKKNAMVTFNNTTNSIELHNKDYSVLALYISTKDKDGVEHEEHSLEYKKSDTIYSIALENVFTNKDLLDKQKVPYEISVLVRHFDKKDTLILDKDKLKLLVLNSNQMSKKDYKFKELFK